MQTVKSPLKHHKPRKTYTRQQSLRKFMNSIILQLAQVGRTRTSQTYRITLNSFMNFTARDIMLNEIDTQLLMEYESHLRNRKLTRNTISFYMRILRAVFNRAVELGLTEQTQPFKRVYTGVEKTIKRALGEDIIRKIIKLDLPPDSSEEFARDIFLFSFYTRGMSFIDIAFLRKTDLINNTLTYRRSKTNQLLSIRWEKCMQDIIDKYSAEKSPYLLPIITSATNERRQYESKLRLINNNLKKISKMLSLTSPITMYVARHSWATIAKNKSIPLSIISQGMGHDSETTTKIYLTSLDSSVIDDANSIIINSIKEI